MANFQDLMRAAENAEKAGDTAAARQLVQMARSLRGGSEPQSQSLQQPAADAGWTGNLTPSAYDPASQVATPQIDNFGDTINAATRDPIAATKAFAGGVMDQSQSPTMQMLPDWVPEQFRGPAARVGDIGGTALGALGTTFGFGAGLAGEMFGGSPTNERKLARDLMMAGQVAVPELAGSSGAMMATQKAARAAQRLDAGGTITQRGARAADDLGIVPSLGSGGKVRGMTAATLEKVPLAGGVIANAATRFVDDVERAYSGAVARVGTPRTSAEAGTVLQKELDQFAVDFKNKSRTLYAQVGEKLPDGTVLQAPNASQAIRDALAPFADNPEIAKQLGLDKWASMADGLDRGLTWRAASDLRTSIGESIGKIKGPLADMDEGKLKLAYAKLTEDLEAAAKAAGPDAEKAWRRASNYYRRGAERIGTYLDKTITAQSPERAFEAFVAMTKKDRASADARRMYEIKASMPADQWGDLSATIIDRLGRAKSGAQNADGDAFSPAAFLTEWNKLSPEGKNLLLPSEVRSEMNKLAEVAAIAKEGGAERNFSNTGTIMTGAGVGAAATQAPVSTALFLGGSWASAKVLTNPMMLRALNKLARGDARQMKAIANRNGAFAQDARTILRITAADAAATGPAANAATDPRAIRAQQR